MSTLLLLPSKFFLEDVLLPLKACRFQLFHQFFWDLEFRFCSWFLFRAAFKLFRQACFLSCFNPYFKTRSHNHSIWGSQICKLLAQKILCWTSTHQAVHALQVLALGMENYFFQVSARNKVHLISILLENLADLRLMNLQVFFPSYFFYFGIYLH